MRGVFGWVGLLVALALVAWLAKGQLGAYGLGRAAGKVEAPPTTVREQSRSLQEQVKADAAKALQQGAQRASDVQP